MVNALGDGIDMAADGEAVVLHLLGQLPKPCGTASSFPPPPRAAVSLTVRTTDVVERSRQIANALEDKTLPAYTSLRCAALTQVPRRGRPSRRTGSARPRRVLTRFDLKKLDSVVCECARWVEGVFHRVPPDTTGPLNFPLTSARRPEVWL